jgi:hypothetical protein
VRHARDGWWSRKLEQTEPACTLRAELLALLIPTRGDGTYPDPALRLNMDGRASVATFTGEGEWSVRFDLDDPVSPVQVNRGGA